MKTEITGNIGKIEARYTPKGTAVVNFSVAENRESEGKEYTNWFNVTAWGDLAEKINENCSKGACDRVEAYRVEAQAWAGQDGPQAKTVFTAGDVSTWSGGKKVDGGHFTSVKEVEEAVFEDDSAIPF